MNTAIIYSISSCADLVVPSLAFLIVKAKKAMVWSWRKAMFFSWVPLDLVCPKLLAFVFGRKE